MKTIDRENAIVTHDSGTPRSQLTRFYRAPVPRSFSRLGKRAPAGFIASHDAGAKVAAPDKLAVAFLVGDAAFGMCAMDLETAVRERIPVPDDCAEQFLDVNVLQADSAGDATIQCRLHVGRLYADRSRFRVLRRAHRPAKRDHPGDSTCSGGDRTGPTRSSRDYV